MENSAYQKCLDTIYRLGRFGIKLELETIQNILKLLNYPHKNYNIVHIAGTNGKGSTASYIASILRKAGFKTGIYTSPHLVKFNERIVIDGEQISDDAVVQAYNAVHSVDMGKRRATFFEITTAMAFYHFSKANVEWAVIETGMGGRFDATNIVLPKVAVITNLSIEHTDYLGSTIKDLAKEKGGIIKNNTPVVTAVSQPSGIEVLQRLAKDRNADLFRHKKDFSARKKAGQEIFNYSGIHGRFNGLTKPLPGDHQKENMSLALAACEIIFKKFKTKDPRYNLTEELVKEGLGATRWPGRLEVVRQKPEVIVDGAHNFQAAKVLSAYLSERFADRKLTLVVGILDDKPHEKMLQFLLPSVDRVIVTKAKIDRSIEPEVLERAVKKLSKAKVKVIEDVQDAVSYAIDTSGENDAVCIAGSLYVAGEAKEKLDKDLI